MNFVDGYGSDSDDGGDVNVASKSTPVLSVQQTALAPSRPTTVANPQAGANAVKKVKRLDISFLPPEIQAALARGDSMRDSDDEDDVKVLPKTRLQPVVADDPASSILLGMLPAPKSKEGAYSDTGNSKVAPRVQSANAASGNASAKDEASSKVSAPKSAFSFGYTTVEKTKAGAMKAAQGTGDTATASSVGSKKSSAEVEEKSTVLPWFQEATARPSAFAPAPAASKISYSVYNPSTQSSSSNGYGGLLGASAYGLETTEPAAVQPPQLSYEEYQRQNQILQQQQEEQELPAHKKRKDRNFELQLMSGDLSGLQHAPVQDITVQHQWNELAYTEQQQREQEVQRGFGIGVNKNLMQVSKQQSRKHQLSSLAMKAAETELAMLEKRGNRNLTKSETQGKYGW